MFVLCPHCQFLVALDPASGQPPSRCPRCKGLVQGAAIILAAPAAVITPPAQVAVPASSNKQDTAPPSPHDLVAAQPAQAAPVEVPIAQSQVADAHVDPATDAGTPVDEPAGDESAPPAIPRQVRRKRAPSFVRLASQSAVTSKQSRWRAWAAITGLAVLLMLQIVLADRSQLAADARWRPLLARACGMLRCSLPPWREPAALVLLDRDVRPDRALPGVLLATASFRNDARWSQPWPTLVLTLNDVDGRTAGTRAFAPNEYLAARTTQNTLASGQSASIEMRIVEPTPSVVAFTFELR